MVGPAADALAYQCGPQSGIHGYIKGALSVLNLCGSYITARLCMGMGIGAFTYGVALYFKRLYIDIFDTN